MTGEASPTIFPSYNSVHEHFARDRICCSADWRSRAVRCDLGALGFLPRTSLDGSCNLKFTNKGRRSVLKTRYPLPKSVVGARQEWFYCEDLPLPLFRRLCTLPVLGTRAPASTTLCEGVGFEEFGSPEDDLFPKRRRPVPTLNGHDFCSPEHIRMTY